MGGSDFHGIDPNTERAPGGIPFPRKQVEIFLAHAKSVWERPLNERLHAMIGTAKQHAAEDAQVGGSPEELLIWQEQIETAQQTCAALGAELEMLEDAESASQYRTIRVRLL